MVEEKLTTNVHGEVMSMNEISNFKNEAGEPVAMGSWWPTYFRYIERGDARYLIVSDKEFVRWCGIQYKMNKVDNMTYNGQQPLICAGTYWRTPPFSI